MIKSPLLLLVRLPMIGHKRTRPGERTISEVLDTLMLVMLFLC